MKIKLNTRLASSITVILVFIVGLIIIILAWKDLRPVLGQANWWLALPALLFTAVSYLCLSYSSAFVFRTFGIKLRLKDLVLIGFISNVVTFTVNIGGVTGTSLQFLLLKRRGLKTEDILAPAFFQLYLNGLMLVILLPIGLFTILASHSMSPRGDLGIGLASGMVTLLLLLAGVLVINAPLRSKISRSLSRVIKFVTHRDVQIEIADFNTALSSGVSLMRQRPVVLVLLLVLAVCDWASTIAALWFCFLALGVHPGMGALITGFSLGIIAGFISFIPGGLGTQEGSMAGIYALLGVPLATGLVAAVLFRFVYYFGPFLFSLVFYRQLLGGAVPQPNQTKAHG